MFSIPGYVTRKIEGEKEKKKEKKKERRTELRVIEINTIQIGSFLYMFTTKPAFC